MLHMVKCYPWLGVEGSRHLHVLGWFLLIFYTFIINPVKYRRFLYNPNLPGDDKYEPMGCCRSLQQLRDLVGRDEI